MLLREKSNRTQLDAVRKAKDNIQRGYENNNNALNQVESELASTTAVKDKLTSTVSQLTAENGRIAKQLEATQTEYSDFKESHYVKINATSSQIAQTENNNAKLTSDVANLRRELVSDVMCV